MQRRRFITVFATFCVCAAHPGHAATKESPGKGAKPGSRTAHVLAAHGEWELAWESLRAGPGAASGDLAVRVLTRLGRVAEAESVLAGLARRPSQRDGASERFFVHVQRARLQVEARKFARALESLSPIDAAGDPLYGAYRDFVLARARLGSGDAAGAQAALDRATSGATPAALDPEIGQLRIDVLSALGRHGEALAAAYRAVDGARDAGSRAQLRYRCYRIAVGLDDETEIARAADRLFKGHRASREARECALDFLPSAAGARAPSSVLLSCASVLQAQGQATEWRRALRMLNARTLTGVEAESRRLMWGEYHFMRGDYARSIAIARRPYAAADLRRRSMLLLARSLRRTGQRGNAAKVYEAYAIAFPNDDRAAEALFTASTLYADLGEAVAADRTRDHVRRSYPSTFYGRAAGLARANALERKGQADEAADIFEQWLARSGRTDEAALFYLARVRTSSGAPHEPQALLDELAEVNPYSFYARPDVKASATAPGVTARGKAALSQWLAANEARREEAYRRVLAAAGDESDPDGETHDALMRVHRFLEAGFDDWAQRELEVVIRRAPDDAARALRLARLCDENGLPSSSLRLYERARADIPWEERREQADEFRYLTYPIPYPAQVFEASSSNDVAPYLLYGLMREESHFNSDAVSGAGAVGLMQLLPGTASRVAAQMDLAWEGEDQLGDPEFNLAVGAWYAADLLHDGRGSVAWMLAAYNAGPIAARRWIEPGTVGEAAIDAVESIDYRETRGYVKRVVESANIYHDLYFGGGGSATGSPR